MKNFKRPSIVLFSLVFGLLGCQSNYITPQGQRLLQNTALGCIAGDIFFDNCKAGAAVGAGSTIVDDQTD